MRRLCLNLQMRGGKAKSEAMVGSERELSSSCNAEQAYMKRLTCKLEQVLSMRRKTQPISERSAGSVFRNPVGQGITAGELIDLAGLKGFQIGGAKVSEVHANFFVNSDGSSSKDMLELINFVKERVHHLFGVQLKEEIRYVPYNFM
ncbi:uncharacterized protein A4U43_C01F32170 [Asparagus officinalis]|uniref:UDP-N-acetylenolpyruvoylglucosamine reductase C-terminal domain-containing protein n=1 Tax=Asparagus officinalis TaxID=4686 RepID=A0A5P1FU16_ASPOF|nr:uncharacterized protein A4U43_C01F32170 [Asparagus officinalis]